MHPGSSSSLFEAEQLGGNFEKTQVSLAIVKVDERAEMPLVPGASMRSSTRCGGPRARMLKSRVTSSEGRGHRVAL